MFLYLSLSPCLAQSTTDTTTAATDSFLTTSYSPQPPDFELGECTSSFDSVDQMLYICIEHQELFPILKYAEKLAKKTCEECFQNELWNCSGFSLLRQPNITKGGKRCCRNLLFSGCLRVLRKVVGLKKCNFY